ncbi:MAG TPA: UvrD-helicase domain-containing protein [Candidatus Marinimicrobia bacterium]|nr:UvrD-helicase domain-containing protein [Candidatus Neomarinimicrobiota bacterium]HRS52312.1 UvrD-helicase domain-containing protein [Candidatus Neomarinimicrobiota bacterium]HRU92050.1 UvrD-helicase domain-containing protein [Candidatus Neomarinimicrobiota bacterium]
MKSLEGLNPEQCRAVEFCDGPSLIFAGAGSGKTKVLAHKVAYLIENKIVAPQNILAVTFTNKAARELRDRVEKYIGKKAGQVNIGTFHSICARLLRREIECLGYSSNFTIYDAEDQLSLLKKIINDRSIILESTSPKNVLSRISYLKNHMIEPENFSARPGLMTDRFVTVLYPLYQGALRKAMAVDFDDLLILPLKIFQQKPEVLEKYRALYQYILVDEYQDTNRPQFLLIEALGKKHQHVCVVGDDDQSIYSWRGADIRNILSFNEIFPQCRVFKLEQNYRSTNNILKAASAVVSHNKQRATKTLWSQKSDGDLLVKLDAETEYDEAALIASWIQREILQNKRNFKDFAILYRTNAQTRILEEILRRNNIVYVIVGGVRFYERKEIKDVLAFFNVISNPHDDISLKRIINLPPRGISKVTVQRLEELALIKKISLFDAMSFADELDLATRAIESVKKFYNQINDLRSLRNSLSFEEWARVVIVSIGLRNYYKESEGEEATERLANLDELLNDISEFCQTNDKPSLESYLENVTLATSIDEWEDTKNAVTLMTLHGAKGLEFPVVFICGLNQGLLPLERDLTHEALEEERRLFYVGLTRAKEKVFLSSSHQRLRAGEVAYSSESMFLNEIPSELMTTCDFRESVISSKRQPRTGSRSSDRKIKNTFERVITNPISMSETTSNLTETTPTTGRAIEPGTYVSHKIFGTGQVVNIDGVGQNARVTVNFRSCGRKTIVARFLNIN